MSDARDDDPAKDDAPIPLKSPSTMAIPLEGTMRMGLSDVRGRHLYEMGEQRTLCGLPRAAIVAVNVALAKDDDCGACRRALKR